MSKFVFLIDANKIPAIETWVKRLIKFAPITNIKMELVKFDLQKTENHDDSELLKSENN